MEKPDESGALREIVLIETLRGKFKESDEGKFEFYWETVPGNFFVIKYSGVKNLNITYVQVPLSPSPEVPGAA